MFVIEVTYKQPMEKVDTYLAEHRAFLETGYQQDYFIASGPQNPRTGGIILSQLQDRKQLEGILHRDPFHIHNIAEYRIIEFNPVKFHKDFSKFIN